MAAEDAELAEPRELEDHRHEQQEPDAHERAGAGPHGDITSAVCAPAGLLVSTWTKSICFRSANGLMCTRW